jgi:protein-L-isoaspartate(D-aspartate) O-methyltransferase
MNDNELVMARKRMVEKHISARGVREARLLAALESVPRHCFVPPDGQPWAYSDSPLSIGHGQTISQPYIVALMTELLHLEGDERVLEIGTGSGYQAAVLGKLAAEVHSIEVIPELAMNAEKTLADLGYTNIRVHIGDGSGGWPEAAPYAGILVAAAAPSAPQPLLSQLAEGGRLVIPVGSLGFQQLEVWTRTGQEFKRQVNLAVAFVPLRGEFGWK